MIWYLGLAFIAGLTLGVIGWGPFFTLNVTLKGYKRSIPGSHDKSADP